MAGEFVVELPGSSGVTTRPWPTRCRSLYGIAFLSMGAFVTLYNDISYHLMAPTYGLSAALVGGIFLLYRFGTLSSAWMGRLSDRQGRGLFRMRLGWPGVVGLIAGFLALGLGLAWLARRQAGSE